MVFYIIACNEDGKTEEDIQRKICDQVLKDKGRDIGTVHHMTNEKVMKTSFKVGSLDQLMELMDIFQKYDVSIDGQCKRNERMYEEIMKEKGLPFKAVDQL